MKIDSDVTEDLAKIVELKICEIKHWRNMIDKHADGDNQLKEFENLFTETKEKFVKFKDMTVKNRDTADILENKLNKNIAERRKTIDSLNNDILALKKSIEKQTMENEHLERELKDYAERFHKLKHTIDQMSTYSNNINHNTSNNSSINNSGGGIIQRLRNDL